jgi:hypothetical protein
VNAPKCHVVRVLPVLLICVSSVGIQAAQLLPKFCVNVRRYTGLLTLRNSNKEKNEFYCSSGHKDPERA